MVFTERVGDHSAETTTMCGYKITLTKKNNHRVTDVMRNDTAIIMCNSKIAFLANWNDID